MREANDTLAGDRFPHQKSLIVKDAKAQIDPGAGEGLYPGLKLGKWPDLNIGNGEGAGNFRGAMQVGSVFDHEIGQVHI